MSSVTRRASQNILYDIAAYPQLQTSIETTQGGISTYPVFEVLMTIFSPFIHTAYKHKRVFLRAKKDVFMRRFGITSDILDYIDRLNTKGLQCILAGGKMIDFVNSISFTESVNDYDLFFTTEQNVSALTKIFQRSLYFKALAVKSYVHDWVDLRHDKKIQIIQNIYAEPFEALTSFDFRACAVAYDGEYIYWLKGSIKDIRCKKITIQNLEPRRTTFVRIEKYLKKGYTIDAPGLGLAAISFLGAMSNRMSSAKFYTKGDFSYLDALDMGENYLGYI